jgi:tRNA threonylcarbamoyladenosine biosynthesis protein TsaE
MTARAESRFEFDSPERTFQWGATLGEMLLPGDLIALDGDLGAGKTTLTKGIAVGVGIRDEVTSPTFTLVHEYRGALPMFHIDPYRLERPEFVLDLGLEEYLERGGVTVIEWASRLGSLLPDERLAVMIEIPVETDGDEPTMRLVRVAATGDRYVRLLSDLAASWANRVAMEPAP